MGIPEWESFIDQGYYGLYAVRRVGDRSFKTTLHVMTAQEADFLVEQLNELEILKWVKEESNDANL